MLELLQVDMYEPIVLDYDGRALFGGFINDIEGNLKFVTHAGERIDLDKSNLSKDSVVEIEYGSISRSLNVALKAYERLVNPNAVDYRVPADDDEDESLIRGHHESLKNLLGENPSMNNLMFHAKLSEDLMDMAYELSNPEENKVTATGYDDNSLYIVLNKRVEKSSLSDVNQYAKDFMSVIEADYGEDISVRGNLQMNDNSNDGGIVQFVIVFVEIDKHNEDTLSKVKRVFEEISNLK